MVCFRDKPAETLVWCDKKCSILFFFTQHAGLPLQKRQDVLVEEQRAETEEIPQAQVGHGAPVPHPWLCLDNRRLCNRDLQHLLPWQALAAGQHHSLLAGVERWHEAPQRVPGRLPAAWHLVRCLRAPRGPTGGWWEGGEGVEESLKCHSILWLVWRLIQLSVLQ